MATIVLRCHRSVALFNVLIVPVPQATSPTRFAEECQIPTSLLSPLPRSTWFPKDLFRSCRCDMASVSSCLAEPSQFCPNLYTKEFACERISWNRCCQARCVATARAQFSFQELRWPIHVRFSRALHMRNIWCVHSVACRVPVCIARNLVCALLIKNESKSDRNSDRRSKMSQCVLHWAAPS